MRGEGESERQNTELAERGMVDYYYSRNKCRDVSIHIQSVWMAARPVRYDNFERIGGCRLIILK